MDPIALVVIAACWALVVIVWIAGAAFNAAHSQGDSMRGEVDVVASIVAVALISGVVVVGSRYARTLVVTAPVVRGLGLALLLASTAFALWARRSLGTSWSINPRVGGDHRLRTSGPYAVTRHPIYTGLLGMLIGSGLLAGLGEWLVVIVAALIGIELKIRMEERLLLAAFPDEYPRYRERVPQLVPGVATLRRLG
jgi:protein-S-isoprenylcysteine O-methyltransferase Ste14